MRKTRVVWITGGHWGGVGFWSFLLLCSVDYDGGDVELFVMFCLRYGSEGNGFGQR